MSDRTWTLYCTHDAYEGLPLAVGPLSPDDWPCLIAHVTDEIEAVSAFRAHVEFFGAEHVPYIYMIPTPPTTPSVGELLAQVNLWRLHPSHLASKVGA